MFLGRYKMKSRFLLPRQIRAEGYRSDDTTSDSDDDADVPGLEGASASSDNIGDDNHGRMAVGNFDGLNRK